MIGWMAVALMMFLLWLLHFPIKNAALVDVGWSLGVPLVTMIYSFLLEAHTIREILVLSVSSLWGLRLGLYLLFTRILGHTEEGRYQNLRKTWNKHTSVKFFLFFQFQGILDLIFSVPFLLILRNPEQSIHPAEWFCLGLWVVAFSGNGIADAQLHRFLKQPANRGRTCREGLWRYSRHPNYFFEFLMWVALACMALPSSFGYIAFFIPLLLLYFLFRITGIPATEAQALRTRGEDYRHYQKTTSAFIPWIPKRSKSDLH